ncbi:MAG: hypothetical protein GX265_02215 [Mollicutes bacterium]|nr:hypothetical protein [Mollicutes bacterium]
MKENLKRHTKRIRNLVITLVLTALILSVSTYAWFIGMRTVTVNEFSVEIATTKELELSLDGKKWSDNVSINKDNFDDDNVVYADHTNWWAGEGLIPMSSVGQIDSNISRLILYEKSSLTQSAGGYRIMTSRAENDGADEVDGYVAFDLFIRNHSGSDYIVGLDEDNEEAIYLSVDSAVTVSDTNGVPGTGIENSVRVAFAQIGRVKGTFADEDQDGQGVITNISCANDTNVTGICTRTAQIWEPNDVDHVPGAISWYNTACRKRTGATTFEGACGDIQDGAYYPTYAVANEIEASDAVDVYDGEEYNGYSATISSDPEDGLLYKFPTFKDTDKLKKGMLRPVFMTLAPNSVTKVRVYVWIEGQDVDNYDFAAIGKAISVKFGFTKQRFTEEDFGYTGPTSKPTTTTVPTTTAE